MWVTPSLDPVQLTLNFFSYFTILTNVLMMVAMLLPAILPNSAAGRVLAGPRVRGGVTLYAAVVGLVYHFLLHATWDPQGWLLLANVLLHYVMPTAMVLSWLEGRMDTERVIAERAIATVLHPQWYEPPQEQAAADPAHA